MASNLNQNMFGYNKKTGDTFEYINFKNMITFDEQTQKRIDSGEANKRDFVVGFTNRNDALQHMELQSKMGINPGSIEINTDYKSSAPKQSQSSRLG